MSMFKKNDGTIAEFKYTVCKTFLSDEEMSAFIGAVVESVVNSEVAIPYYTVSSQHINQFTMAIYLDALSKSKLDDEPNVYNVIRDIKAQIDMDQYYDMLTDIREGVKCELHKKTANFGLGDLGDPADMMAELQGLIAQIGSDETIQKVVDIGINDTAIKKANKAVKKENAKKPISE